MIGSVATVEEALHLCGAFSVSVLVLGDLLLGRNLSGASALLAALPATTRPLLIANDQCQVASMIELGFWGCLPQTASGAEVIRAVQAVASGELWAPRHVLSYLIRERQCTCGHGTLPSENGAQELTPREVEILELVARGHNNDQIAAALFIGRSTVKTHLLRSFRKLEAVDRTSAVTIALRRNLIRTGEG